MENLGFGPNLDSVNEELDQNFLSSFGRSSPKIQKFTKFTVAS